MGRVAFLSRLRCTGGPEFCLELINLDELQ